MTGRSTLLVAVLIAATPGAGHLAAQTAAERTVPDALRRQVERRFEALPLRDGIALRPRSPMAGVRSIEITGGAIAIDGVPATGAELRTRLGDAADLVVQLSYLDAATLRRTFGGGPAAPSTSSPAAPAVAPPAPAPAPPEPRTSRSARSGSRRGDRVRFGESITVGPDETVDGDVVVIGGSAHVEGTVHGDLVAVGGSIDLGPQAVVEGDVTSVGGSIRRAEGARIDGRTRDVGVNAMGTNWIGPRTWFRGWASDQVGSSFALIATIARGLVVALLAGLVVLLAGAYVDKVGTRAVESPFKAGAIGFLSQMLFLPLLIMTIVILVVTLVGIPILLLLPFALLGLAVVGLVGFTAVVERVGRLVGERFGWVAPSAYATTAAGIGAMLLPLVVARLALATGGMGVSFLWHTLAFVGLAVEYVAWTVGFGAVVLTRLQRKLEAPQS